MALEGIDGVYARDGDALRSDFVVVAVEQPRVKADAFE
jgi:hypothetical protein